MDPSNSEKKRKLNSALDRRHPCDGVQGGGFVVKHSCKQKKISVGGAFVVWKRVKIVNYLRD